MPKDSTRASHFPAIEKKYGEKMAYWFKVMAKLEGKKYPEQIAHLKENYGFSQAHANAMVTLDCAGQVLKVRIPGPFDYAVGEEVGLEHAGPVRFFSSATPE